MKKKAHLAWQISGERKKLLDQLDYVEMAIVFMWESRSAQQFCSSCSFSSGALGDWEHRVEDYLAALMKELEAIAKISEGKKS